jgi:hypothetical protein
MNTRNAVLGVAAVGLIGVGIWWATRPAPTPVAEKPVAVAAAPAAPASKAAAPVVPTKMTVAAPVAHAVAPSASPQPAVAVAASTTDANLKTAVDDLVRALETQDANAFVQDYIAPGLLDVARAAASARLGPNTPPEVRAQVEQAIQQQLPQMVQQMTQQISQDPRAAESFQKLGAALKQAANNPPEMNATGDRATYTLDTNGDKEVPSKLTMMLHDGKWILDFMSMARGAQAQGQ